MFKTTFLSIICLTLLVSAAGAHELSDKEQKVLKIVEANNKEAIKFLENSVNINSGTMNFAGVKANGMFMKKAFDAIGFDSKWIAMPKEVNRAGHLFAEKKGKGGKRLLLIGHLDTVFEKNSSFQKFSRKGDVAYGPGANDMKGGNVIILFALKALHEAGLLNNAQIIVAYHGDEEKAGKPISISRRDLIEAARRSDVVLGFETSSGFDYAVVARRGSSGWSLSVKGKRAHSSGIFRKSTGAGAIFEAARILNSFYEELRGEKFLTFNPGVILGGTQIEYDRSLSKGDAFGKSNVVAQTVRVSGGLRFISEEQKENARNRMRQIVSRNLPQTSATISFTDSYPAMPPTEGNMAVLKVLDKVSRDLGQGPVKAFDPGRRGAADISFIAKYVDGLDGLGSMGRGAHSPRESINLKTFEALTKRTAILIHRLMNQKPG